MVKLAGPDSVEPPGPVAVARTDPRPWPGEKAEPLSVADQRLPEPLAPSVVMRPPTCTLNVTVLASPVVPVETVAVVGFPQPDRLSIVLGETDGVKARGGLGRVVVVVAPALPPRTVIATAALAIGRRRPMPSSSRVGGTGVPLGHPLVFPERSTGGGAAGPSGPPTG